MSSAPVFAGPLHAPNDQIIPAISSAGRLAWAAGQPVADPETLPGCCPPIDDPDGNLFVCARGFLKPRGHSWFMPGATHRELASGAALGRFIPQEHASGTRFLSTSGPCACSIHAEGINRQPPSRFYICALPTPNSLFNALTKAYVLAWREREASVGERLPREPEVRPALVSNR